MANELKKALAAAKKDESWRKMTRNKMGQFKYADLPHILDIVEPPLEKHGLVVNFEPRVRDGIEIMVTVLTHLETGMEVTAESVVVFGKDFKSWGGCCTYMKRYGLLAVLGIAVTDDFDPDSSIKIKPDQVAQLQEAIKKHGPSRSIVFKDLLAYGKVESLEDIYQDEFNYAMKFITDYKGK